MKPSAPKTAASALAFIAAAAVLIPLPILLHDGWPRTHERFAAFERIEAFRRAFAAGILFPTWTPFAGWGWGSPWPLFYHRLYPSLGAVLSFITGSPLASFKVLLVLLLFGAGAGMRRLLRVVGVSELLATAGALLLIASPYVLTDWIVRNAMAELTAFMLLPWLYAELALVAEGQPQWLVLGGGIVLLFHAHSLICYFFLLSLLLFALVYWKRWRLLLQEPRRLAGAVALVAVGTLPSVLVSSDLMRHFNVEVLTSGMWRVEANYQPLAHLFIDPFDWRTWQAEKISVELNRFVWLALAVVVPLLIATDRWREAVARPLHLFMALWGVFCLFLQMPDFAFVFHALPKAEFLQFPWRLLSFLSISAIFLLMVWADAALRAGDGVRRAGLVITFATVLLTIGHFGSVPWLRQGVEQFTAEKLATKVANLDGPNSFGEYLLPGMGKDLPLPPPKQPVVNAECADKLDVPESFGADGILITGELDAPCRVAVRQFQTPLVDVIVRNGALLSPTPSDSIIVELQPGRSSIRLRWRSFGELLWARVSRRDP